MPDLALRALNIIMCGFLGEQRCVCYKLAKLKPTDVVFVISGATMDDKTGNQNDLQNVTPTPVTPTPVTPTYTRVHHVQ